MKETTVDDLKARFVGGFGPDWAVTYVALEKYPPFCFVELDVEATCGVSMGDQRIR